MITFSALVNIILFSSIAVALLSIILRNNRAVLQLDVRFLLICMLGILFRLLIPVESPVTRSIAVNRIYPEVYMFLKTPVMKDTGLSITVLIMMKAIWFTGAFIAVIRLIYSYRSIMKSVEGFCEVTDSAIIDIAEQINAKRRKAKTFHIMTTDSVYTPFIFGINKTYIIIPEIEMSKEEMRFALKHEMMHFYRGDPVIKLFAETLKAVYWWNPFIYLLNRLIAQMQEINVDFSVMKDLPDMEKLDYSDFLVRVAKIREKHKSKNKLGIAFQKESSSVVRKRVGLMLENMEITKKKTFMSLILSAVILCQIVLCPNILIFEPYSIPEADAEGSVGAKDNEIFYLDNHDGTYDLWMSGQYFSTVTKIFDDDIQVFNSIEEAKRHD